MSLRLRKAGLSAGTRPNVAKATARPEELPQKPAGTLKKRITCRDVFFCPEPNETSLSLDHVQWAQQFVEAWFGQPMSAGPQSKRTLC